VRARIFSRRLGDSEAAEGEEVTAIKGIDMRLPTIRGLIERRILANYRVDPDRLRAILPEPFRPQLVKGYGIAGICMIRLAQIRPRRFPAALGVSSENAAHRIAVEWDDVGGATRRGVYIPRRDTASRFNTLAGGRIFAGVHHHARFDVDETEETFNVGIVSDDGETRVSIEAGARMNCRAIRSLDHWRRLGVL